MTIVNGVCNLCDTTIFHVVEGVTVKFTKHDAAFCEAFTLEKIKILTRLLQESEAGHRRVQTDASRLGHAVRVIRGNVHDYHQGRGGHVTALIGRIELALSESR